VESLAITINAQRPLVAVDDSAVPAFNAAVDRHNQMVTRLRHLELESKQQVQQYNELVDKANAQAATANRLVDAYNAKLARYGTPK